MGAPPAPPKRPVSRASPLAGLLQTTSVPTLLADAAALQLPGLGALGGAAAQVPASCSGVESHMQRLAELRNSITSLIRCRPELMLCLGVRSSH